MTSAQMPEVLPPGLGERLRTARLAKGLSARAFARSVGVSPSLISQIELGKAVPSVGTLYAMVSKLGVSLDEVFFDSAPLVFPPPEEGSEPGTAPVQDAAGEEGLVLRRANRARIGLASGVTWERLTPDHDYEVDFLLVTYDVGGETCPPDALMRHSGKEYGLVMSGRLGVTVGFTTCELGPGDSIVFDSSRPHRFWCSGAQPAQALWTVVGRAGGPRFPSARAEG